MKFLFKPAMYIVTPTHAMPIVPVEYDREFYWSYIRDGELYDAEYETKDEAIQEANDKFCQECYDRELGGVIEEPIVLIQFCYTNGGNMSVLKQIDSYVFYEDYHGDYAEHNIMWNVL